jgi:hypothetical protein
MNMLAEYLQAALDAAHYEIIQDQEPYYGEVPGLEGPLGLRQYAGGMQA